MSAVPVLRLAPKPLLRRKAKRHACCNQAHAFATSELVIRQAGQIVRRLRPVPGGFVEVTP